MFFKHTFLAAALALLAGVCAAGDQLPPVRHVFLIVLENKDFADTFQRSPQDPYFRKVLTKQGVLLTQYYGTGHFSLDNYLAMISGQASSRETEADCEQYADFKLKSITSDGQAVGSGCVYPAQIHTLADQLEADGLSWKAYMEDMGNDPARESEACAHPALDAADPTQRAEAPRQGLPAGDQYAVRHNPFMYFHSIIDNETRCKSHVIRLYGLMTDLQSAVTTPNFSFITPNLCHDGHDGDGTGARGRRCADGNPGGLTSTDAFLRTWVPRILDSPAYRQDGLLIITFDEGDFSGPKKTIDPVTGKVTLTMRAAGQHCCNQQIGPNIIRPLVLKSEAGSKVISVTKIDGYGGDRIGAVLLSPYIKPGTVSDTPYNHYALLRSIEDIFGLDHLGYAAQSGLRSFGPDVFSQGTQRVAAP